VDAPLVLFYPEEVRMSPHSAVFARAAPVMGTIPLQFISPLPVVMAQMIPHSTFEKVGEAARWFSAIGCDAIHISPIHPPSQINVEGKRGSVYAAQDHMRVAPYLYDHSLNPHRWLDGDYVDKYQDPEEGWQALAALVSVVKASRMKLVGDLVFCHTARDPQVVRHHLSLLGEDFYKRSADGTIAYEGAMNDGRFDAWKDTAAINFSSPGVVSYFTDVVNKHIDAGISVFRADSAGKISPDVWRQIIAGAKSYASAKGLETPHFYAEVFENQAAYIRAGFEGSISLYRWGLTKYHQENYEGVRRAGGSEVLYPDNHDVDRASLTHPTRQEMYTYLAQMAFLTSSFMFMEGTTHFEKSKPSVFLDRVGSEYNTFSDPEQRDASMLDLLRKLANLKKQFPVFHSDAYTRLEIDGSGLIQVRRVVPLEGAGAQAQEALIIFNSTSADLNFSVPLEYQYGGHIFWTNRNKFGTSNEELKTVDYLLPAHGLSLFVRSVADIDTLGYRIPGYN